MGLLVVHVGVSVDVVGGDETAATRLATLVISRIWAKLTKHLFILQLKFIA